MHFDQVETLVVQCQCLGQSSNIIPNAEFLFASIQPWISGGSLAWIGPCTGAKPGSGGPGAFFTGHLESSSCSSWSKAGTIPAFDEGTKAAAGAGSFLLEEEGSAHSDSEEVLLLNSFLEIVGGLSMDDADATSFTLMLSFSALPPRLLVVQHIHLLCHHLPSIWSKTKLPVPLQLHWQKLFWRISSGTKDLSSRCDTDGMQCGSAHQCNQQNQCHASCYSCIFSILRSPCALLSIFEEKTPTGLIFTSLLISNAMWLDSHSSWGALFQLTLVGALTRRRKSLQPFSSMNSIKAFWMSPTVTMGSGCSLLIVKSRAYALFP